MKICWKKGGCIFFCSFRISCFWGRLNVTWYLKRWDSFPLNSDSAPTAPSKQLRLLWGCSLCCWHLAVARCPSVGTGLPGCSILSSPTQIFRLNLEYVKLPGYSLANTTLPVGQRAYRKVLRASCQRLKKHPLWAGLSNLRFEHTCLSSPPFLWKVVDPETCCWWPSMPFLDGPWLAPSALALAVKGHPGARSSKHKASS